MRRRVAFGALLTTVALLGGLVGAAPAAAKGPPEIVAEEFDFIEPNVCTGQEETFFIRLTLRVHEFEHGVVDRHHSNIQLFVDVATSGGFSGRIVGPDIHNHTGSAEGPSIFEDEEGTGMFAAMGNGVISNRETGQRFRFHLNFHFVLVKGTPVVDNFTERVECLGGKGA